MKNFYSSKTKNQQRSVIFALLFSLSPLWLSANQSQGAEIWLEKGYKWSYTMRDFSYDGSSEWCYEDFIRTYSLEAPVEIDGMTYFPLKIRQKAISGSTTFENSQFIHKPNEVIAGWMRQDESTGLIYYKLNREFREDNWSHILQNSFRDISWTAVRSPNLETVCWYGNSYDKNKEELIPVTVKSLGKEYKGYRFSYSEYPNNRSADSYVAYVDRLGLVGVFGNGEINPNFDYGFFSENEDIYAGFNHLDDTVPLLYSIQKGDGTYLVLQEQNAPKKKTDAENRIWNDDTQVTLVTDLPGSLRVVVNSACEVRIYDLAAREVFAGVVSGQQTITLQRGVYIVKAGTQIYKISVN